MLRSQKEIDETNKLLEEVIASGHHFMVGWFRAAVHNYENQKAGLLKDFRELKALFLQAKKEPLTVREAQLCHVCRICRGPFGAPFILHYGEEFAHEGCLQGNLNPRSAGVRFQGAYLQG